MTSSSELDLTSPFYLANDRVKRIYLAGPMMGIEDCNFPAFCAEAERLQSQGWWVENPADHGLVDGATREDCLLWNLGRLSTCGVIRLLPGWSVSKDTKFELGIARELGLLVQFADGAEQSVDELQDDEPSGLDQVIHTLLKLQFYINGFEQLPGAPNRGFVSNVLGIAQKDLEEIKRLRPA